MSEWQPIATAPQNQKVIVSWLNSHGKRRTTFAVFYPAESIPMDDNTPEECVTEEGLNSEAGWFEIREAGEASDGLFNENLTHWMPLPDPPKERA